MEAGSGYNAETTTGTRGEESGMLKKFAEILMGNAPMEATPKKDLLAMATCVLLLEAAWADQEFTEAEREKIMGVMKLKFELDENEAEHLVYKAMEAHTKSTSLFRFTSRLNDALTQEERIKVMEEIWRIIYSDGLLNTHEDHLAHQLKNMLNLNHKQYIDAKLVALGEIKREQGIS